MKKINLLLFALLISFSAMAQKAILKGKIVDNQNQSLPGASVVIESLSTGTFSDVNGEYFINNIEAGTYKVTVSFIGFKPQSAELELSAGKTTLQDFEMIPGLELSEIVISSRLVGEAKALNNQKSAINITNMVSYEQLERFPDANIGDAMKRLTGINVQYDQGEARFGNIRGTAPQLSSITINGERIPSAEAEIRSVQLDLVPSDMIKAIEFNKAVTPDMDADAIGGSVNLVTKSAPYKQQIKGKLGSGWNFIANKPSIKGSFSYSNRFLNDKLGMVLSASAYDKHLGSDNTEAEWAYTYENAQGDDVETDPYASEVQVRQYRLERFRQSYSTAFDYKFNNNHSVYLKGIYNWRNDWENRYRYEATDIEYDETGSSLTSGKVRRQLKFGPEENKYARLEDQRVMSFSGGGDHVFGRLKIDWSAAYSKASEERPDETYVRYAVKDIPITLDLSESLNPYFTIADSYTNLTDEYELDEITQEYQYTKEIDKNFKINFDMPMVSGSNSNSLKFGARYRGKTKMRENEFYEYSPLNEDAFNAIIFNNLDDDFQHSPYYAGDYTIGSFPSKEIYNEMTNLNDESVYEKEAILEEIAGNFNATENILAGYSMFTQNIGSKVTLLAGVRVEQTNLEYQGKIHTLDENGDELPLEDSDVKKDTYTNLLPGFHFKFSPNKAANLRFAWTNTIARPNYYDLVPYVQVNREDMELAMGNPELNPTSSMNFDLMYEHFFNNIGLVSAGIFYKDMKDVIAYEKTDDYNYNGSLYELTQPINISDASLLGFEIAFSRRLDFLPSVFKNISLYGNYTYIQSEMKDVKIDGREDDVLPLAGSPKHTFNASLAYDTKKFDFRISYNHASAYLYVDEEGLGSDSFDDPWYNAVNYLDFNIDYKINNNIRVYANANNLLNQPLQVSWGKPEFERNMQSEYYGIKLSLGLKFKF